MKSKLGAIEMPQWVKELSVKFEYPEPGYKNPGMITGDLVAASLTPGVESPAFAHLSPITPFSFFHSQLLLLQEASIEILLENNPHLLQQYSQISRP